MSGLRHHPRLPWLALAAIVGMLSVAGETSARSTSGAANAPKSCCVVSTPSDCCCCPSKPKTSPEIDRHPASTGGGQARLSAPDRPCECRSDEPAPSASKPESSSTEVRTGRGHEQAVGPTFAFRPPASTDRPIPPTGGPPQIPLDRLTSRLLI